ncbi:hypothetical protein DFH09DRAFT_1287521, partial [Mycena vulgaris]
MADAVLSIQELCDQIAERLALSSSPHGDLKSLALVCHKFRTSAQSQIFGYIILNPHQLPRKADESRHTVYDIAASVLRLSDILATLPHLLGSIKTVSVAVRDPEATFYDSLSRPAVDLVGDAFHLSRDCIGFSSIREVKITHDLTEDFDRFSTLYESCTLELEAVTITDVWIGSPSSSYVAHRGERRAPIRRLKSCLCTREIVTLDRPPPLVWARPLRVPSVEVPATHPANHEAIASLKPDNCVDTLVLDVDDWAFSG